MGREIITRTGGPSPLALADPAQVRNCNWSGRTKHRAPTITTMQGPPNKRNAGDLRLRLLRSKRRGSWSEGEMVEGARSVSHLPKATSFSGELCTALPSHRLRQASLQSVTSLQNENWDEDVRASSASTPMIAASYKLSKNEQSIIMCNINDDDDVDVDVCSNSSNSLQLPLKPSLKSDATPRSNVAKHVYFSFTDKEIRYEVTNDDIKNSWLDIDVSKAVEAIGNESHDVIVSFGPTARGRFTSSDVDTCKNTKVCMVRIQRHRLINEMLGQRKILRESVFEEQARQKRKGIVDAEEMRVVASKESKWGVELARSSWWLSQG